MSKSEYHLLYVLSEPPVAVVHRHRHAWNTGDILFAEKSPAVPKSVRFLVLHVSEHGMAIALRILDKQSLGGDRDGYIELVAEFHAPHPNLGKWMSDGNSYQGPYYVDLDKIYSESMIIGEQHGVNDVKITGRISSYSLSKIVNHFLVRKSLFTHVSLMGCTGMSDITRSTSGRHLTGCPATLSSIDDEMMSVFYKFATTTYHVEQFLDLAYMTFDEGDYTAIRDYLYLPRIDVVEKEGLDCDCDRHRQRRDSQSDETHSRTFFRTLDKINHCAKRLGIPGDPPTILLQLSECALAMNRQPGEPFIHTSFVPRPCYITDLPTELLLNIIESFSEPWDKDSISSFGLTCKLFYEIVNVKFYRSITVSRDADAWDKIVRMLPKFGHLTREIYLDAPQYENNRIRVVYKNLRAIGDYCPNLERLDLSYPLRLDLSATEADLPPRITVEPQETEEGKNNVAANGGPSEDVNIEMRDSDQEHGEMDQENIPPNDDPTDIEHGGHGVDIEGDEGYNIVQDEFQLFPEPLVMQDAQQDDQIGVHAQPDPEEAAAEARYAAQVAAVQVEHVNRKRACAEIDHIIKNCSQLKYFSIQWTGGEALRRFQHKIPKLKALRLWDRLSDADLIETGARCQELERFYLDGQDVYGITVNGLIGFLNALHTKQKSTLKRFGLRDPIPLYHRAPGHPGFGLFDDDDDDDNDDDDMDQDEEDDEVGEDEDEGGDAIPANNQPQQIHIDTQNPPLYRFIDVLGLKHPFIERLSFTGCSITDSIIPLFGRFIYLQSLDLSRPTSGGISAVGVSEIVHQFQGGTLLALDLSYHVQMSDDDMVILTGVAGLKSLRYIRVAQCPKLADRYMLDEWVNPNDLVIKDGTWRPRTGASKTMLEIGDGWKESWND